MSTTVHAAVIEKRQGRSRLIKQNVGTSLAGLPSLPVCPVHHIGATVVGCRSLPRILAASIQSAGGASTLRSGLCDQYSIPARPVTMCAPGLGATGLLARS
jgi:hypothetical protein